VGPDQERRVEPEETNDKGQGTKDVFVDSHCHLDDSGFDPDRDAVIERARIAGLRYVLTIGGASGPDSVGAATSLAENYEWIFAAAGIHPHEASKAEERHFDELRRLARHRKFVAIGEIGLDYHYDHSPRDLQQQVLVRQLDLARELKLPVIIHCRDAWSDLRVMMRSHWQSAGLGGILHCFSGTREDAFELMDAGFLVSFAGNVTYKKAENLRAVAREIPLDRLLTETDSPYLAPVPHRGKRNEPAFVVEVTRQLAQLHGLSAEEVGAEAAKNFERIVDCQEAV
jgi:TatD DNase family protein